jgi:DNA-binding NarL/FixJ family response regulator
VPSDPLARDQGVQPSVKILVVDDQKLVRQTVCSFLAQHPGWQVFEAESGRTALERIQHVNPDVVVLDIVMPGINGLETASEIRRLVPVPKLILISSHYSPEEAEMIARLYGDGNFIQKSEMGKELIPAISRLLRQDSPLR